MTDLVTSLLSPIMEELGKSILERVKRQLNYLCCFNSNIESLREEAENLKNERDDLKRRVDAAGRNTDDTSSVVQAWITDSNDIQVYKNGIEDEIKNAKSGCLAIKSRYLLSRKARNTADAIKIHLEKGKFKPEEISIPALPPSMAPIPQGPSEEFDSRKQIENKIIEDLREGKVHMMGICGMGGVGKTVMAKRIMSTVREEKLFDEVAMVAISQEIVKFPEVRKPKIQSELAEKFGVPLEEKSLSTRADKLRKRLTDETRKLLILDDIWEKLDLEELGIPCKSDEGEGCTIILTSRSSEVLGDMNAKPFGVQVLTPEEALSLFRGKIGTCVDNMSLLPKAEDVVAECKGLPLALATMGAALKDKSIEHWRVALRQLRSPNPQVLPKVLEEVYKPIKVSYDFLDDTAARSLFLFCCLFRENFDTPLESLTMYIMGLRMFTDQITTLEDARDTVHVLVDKLKSCFLLLEGSDKNSVKMHDVVRDAAIYIASEEGRIVCNWSSKASGSEDIKCEWILAVGEEINKLPIRSSFPSLRFLLLFNNPTEPAGISSDSSFFQGMIDLSVVAFLGIKFESLPETTQLLKNLRTLILAGCDSLEKISIVGELLNLEILICYLCSSIAELPVEIGQLKELRMLQVKDCSHLKRIAPGVISNLVQLEELIIVRSFSNWEAKAENGEQRENAAVCEIEHLEKLTRLEIEIEDSTLVAEEIDFPSKIVKFAVIVGGLPFSFHDVPYERKMRLVCKGDITFGKWIHVLLTSTEYLVASGEVSNNLDILRDCSMGWNVGVSPMMEHGEGSNNLDILQDFSMGWSVGVGLEHVFHEECPKITFSNLKILELSNLSRLISFCEGCESIELPLLHIISISGCRNLKSLISSTGSNRNSTDQDDSLHVFFNEKVISVHLMEIYIMDCAGISILFSSSTAENLVNLEILEIASCAELVKMIQDDEDLLCDKPRVLFPSLKKLWLGGLLKLEKFCNWKCDLQLPSLVDALINGCPFLAFFTVGNVTTPNLGLIVIDEENKSLGDLNTLIKQHFSEDKQMQTRRGIQEIEEATRLILQDIEEF